MLNKKRKGFTIVELVIVIAVIAVLAAVLIPTFAGIIDKANESADKQAVRQMNIALAAESIENKPANVEDVIDILAAAGFNSTDKLVPVSAKHGFYWSAAANMVTLIRDEGEGFPELIFPTEETALYTAFTAAATDWTAATTGANVVFFDLETAGEEAGLPTGSGNGSGNGSGTGSGNGSGTGGDDTSEGEPLVIGTPSDEDGAYHLPAGTYYLADDTDINVPVVIEGEATIDLKGQELKLIVNDSNVFSVLGELTIKDTKDENSEAGKIVINNNTTVFTDEKYYLPGICVGDSTAAEPVGKLTLGNVEIEGNAPYYIKNYGTISLAEGTKVTVNGEIGLYNEGIAEITGATFTVNSGTGFANYYAGETVDNVKILGNTSFVLNGADVIAIENDGGRMSVTDTNISKSTGFTYDASYYSGTISVIDDDYSYESEISLENVKVAEGMGTGVNVSARCTATIKSGTYNGAVTSTGNLTITGGEFSGDVSFSGGTNVIKGGTFGTETDPKQVNFNGQATVVEVYAGTFNGPWVCNSSSKAKINIYGGTFNKQFELASQTITITIYPGESEFYKFYNGTDMIKYSELTEGATILVGTTTSGGYNKVKAGTDCWIIKKWS